MDGKEFMQEYEHYTLQDLILIYDTQQDRYTPMEMAIIEELIGRKRNQHTMSRPAQLMTVALSCVIPACGLLVSRMMRRSPDPQEQKAGRICTVLGIITTLLLICFFVYIHFRFFRA